MAQSFTYTVTSTPMLLVRAGNSDDGVTVTISNGTGDDIHLGATKNVAVGAGVFLHKNNGSTVASRLQLNLYAGDEVWAVATLSSVVNTYISGAVQ